MTKLLFCFTISSLLFGCIQQTDVSPIKKLKPDGSPLALIIKPSYGQKGSINNSTNGCSPVGIGRAWNLATCKSNCNSGLGFRCGGYTYQKCSDGSIEIMSIILPTNACRMRYQQESNIPKHHSTLVSSDTVYSRPVKGDFVFYQNGVMKISLGSSISQYTSSSTPALDVEQDTDLYIPNTVINGNTYNWLLIKAGVYLINFSSSTYGDVYVNYEVF